MSIASSVVHGVKTWVCVPARGGSRAIPRKNLRLLGGRPLIQHVLGTAAAVVPPEALIVSTDDEEIAEIGRRYGAVHRRSPATASDEATLDAVALEVTEWLIHHCGASETDQLVVIQPTSPFLGGATLRRAIALLSDESVDTVLTVTDDRHLRWTIGEDGIPVALFAERVNRQWLQASFAETGGIIGCRLGHIRQTGTRIGRRVRLLEVDQREGLDIDHFGHWAVAEYYANRFRIIIRADASHELGFGHVYRALALAECFADHDLSVSTRRGAPFELGLQLLRSRGAPVIEIDDEADFLDLVKTQRPQIVVNDILDTSAEYVRALRETGAFVVNFEDQGTGILEADIVVNDLYPDAVPRSNHWYGVRFAVLNPQFERAQSPAEPSDVVRTILVAFGGSDPSDLTALGLRAIGEICYEGTVVVVLGPGYQKESELKHLLLDLGMGERVDVRRNVQNMAALMRSADLALTSSGRTITELMTVGVPTVALCQNMREMRHSHASSAFGVINLGLGECVSSTVLGRHLRLFIDDPALRRDMVGRMRMAVGNRSNARIVHQILDSFRRATRPDAQ